MPGTSLIGKISKPTLYVAQYPAYPCCWLMTSTSHHSHHSSILLADSLFAVIPWHCPAFHACECHHLLCLTLLFFIYSLPQFCSYSGFMQEGIKSNPTLVQKLRATFLKVKIVNHQWQVLRRGQGGPAPSFCWQKYLRPKGLKTF